MFVKGPTGKPASLEVDASGQLKTTGSGGGGGGAGDASAANQVTQTDELVAIKGFVDGLETSMVALNASADDIEAATEALAALAATPIDSTGLALPVDFLYLTESYGYTGADMTTIVRTKGANTWTKTLTYSGGNLTAISKWVKA